MTYKLTKIVCRDACVTEKLTDTVCRDASATTKFPSFWSLAVNRPFSVHITESAVKYAFKLSP